MATTPTKSELTALRAEYERQKQDILADLPPYSHAMFLVGCTCFSGWLADQGIEAPPPDLSDPYTAKRFAEYVEHREDALRPLSAEGRARVEPHFTSFDQWLSGQEASERLFPATNQPPAKPAKKKKTR
jgi:hypothetical protein